jgi:methionyl-tRNA formyltransferase
MTRYVVASSKNWFREHSKSSAYKNLEITEVTSKEQLNLEFLEKVNPRYIFFPHWNWKVDSEIYNRFECVVFHTSPLPYGRGGSPIQNLILRGVQRSPVCALRMTETLDGGPIYDSIEVSLDGTIQDIFSRIAPSVEKLIVRICLEELHPEEQTGEVVLFKRLSYADNELKDHYSLSQLYDRIRMVDGLDYPRAYVYFGKHKVEVTEAQLDEDHLTAKIKVFLASVVENKNP